MEQLKKIIVDLFRVREEEITDDLSMENTENWDSLKHMELVVAIEGTFGVQLTVDEIVSMVNMNKIKQILSSKGVKV